MARRVLASYLSEEKLADTLNDFKTRQYDSKDFLIFTAETNVESIGAHTDDILNRLPVIRRTGKEGALIDEIKRSFSDGSNTEPPIVSLDKLTALGVPGDQASAYGKEADDGNILILVEEKTGNDDLSLQVDPGESVENKATDPDDKGKG